VKRRVMRTLKLLLNYLRVPMRRVSWKMRMQELSIFSTDWDHCIVSELFMDQEKESSPFWVIIQNRIWKVRFKKTSNFMEKGLKKFTENEGKCIRLWLENLFLIKFLHNVLEKFCWLIVLKQCMWQLLTHKQTDKRTVILLIWYSHSSGSTHFIFKIL